MGPFDIPGNAGLVNSLVGLVKSPRVQYLGNQLKRTVPMAGQPMRLPTPRSGGSRTPGASSRTASNGIGNAMGQGLGALLQSLNGGAQQQEDPLMALYEQLLGQLQSPVDMPSGIDTENLMRQVQDAINPIYDQRIREARSETSRGTKEVKGMYEALAADYERLAPEQLAQSRAAQEEIKQLYGQLRSNVEGNFSRVSQEQGELFKQLGIEDALPDVLDEQDDAVMEASRAASENQVQQQQRYMDMGQADATYYREGSPLATMTGNEISTDLLADLQNYVQQTEAERSSGIQSGYMDQLSQAQNQLMQQQQMAQGEASRRQGMLWEMLQSQLNAKAQPTEMTVDSYMGQLPPETQQSVAGAFTRLTRSPEAVYGKVEDKRNPVPGTFVETTPNWYLAQADEMLKRGEIDTVTHQALQMYMQLYFGMGK